MIKNRTLLNTLTLIGVLNFGIGAISQAKTITVNSTSGPAYSATITVNPTAIVPSTTTGCAYGYNYYLTFDYSVSYTGNYNTLNTLQFNFKCGNTQNGIVTVSAVPGSYTGLKSNSQYTNLNNCGTATLTSNNCLSSIDITVSGSGISNQAFSVSTPLPIGLISFNAQPRGQEMLLNWVSSSNTPGNYFVERSANGLSWQTLGKAGQEQASSSTYQFMDNSPSLGTNFYRLRMEASDGSTDYSHTISQKIVGDGQEIAIYPNPTNTDNIKISGINTPSDWTVQLSNTMSQELMHATLTSNQIALPTLPSGLYFLRFTNAATKEIKLVKLMRN